MIKTMMNIVLVVTGMVTGEKITLSEAEKEEEAKAMLLFLGFLSEGYVLLWIFG